MNNEYERMAEKQINSEDIFNGVILHVVRDDVELPDGRKSSREVIRHIGAACVIPVTESGNVILERQYRYPIDRIVTEIPAGKLESKNEDPLEAAKRELKEETGYEAERWQNLGTFHSAFAYSDETISMFLATGLKAGERKLDEGEFLDVIEVPLVDAVEQVMNGIITDSKTQTAILKAARILEV